MKRRVLTVALAALLAVLGVGAVLAYVRQANNRAVQNLKAETVLEAKGPISAGTSLGKAQNQGLLTTVKIPQGSLSGGVPVRTVNAGNRRLVFTTAVGQGGLVLQSMINTSASVVANGGFIIPQGMVAVTVNLCVQESVANYVTAGSYVAVFDTYANGKGAQIQRSCDLGHAVTNSGSIVDPIAVETRIVLTRVQVLAVGQNASAQSTSTGIASTVAAGSASSLANGVLVTLAVNQADAERLITIDEVGLPYMALLSDSSKTAFQANPTPVFRSH